MLDDSLIQYYRSQFEVVKHSIYLNHAGVAPTSKLCVDAVTQWMNRLCETGISAAMEGEETCGVTRSAAAQLIGAKSSEIAFVRNTSHGLGLVAEGLSWCLGDEVVVARELEYPSNVYPWLHLQRRGVVLSQLIPESGVVTLRAVENAVTEKTRLVALSGVQFANGTKAEMAKIGAFCRTRDILFCVDGIQWVGTEEIDVHAIGIDFLSADSHKWMLGISGIGFLFVNERCFEQLEPVLVGWKSTEDAFNFDRVHFVLKADAQRYEEGSASYPLIAGFREALDMLLKVGVGNIQQRIKLLHRVLEETLKDETYIFSPPLQWRGGSLFLRLPDAAKTEALYQHLQEKNVVTSLRRGAIRISPHFYNTPEELEKTAKLISEFSGI